MDWSIFKQCQYCEQRWDTRADFIADEEVVLIGYQALAVAVERGLFLFNHSCGNTLSIKVETFADLYAGPVYVERNLNTASCPGHCLHISDLRPCPKKCECTYVRAIIQLLKPQSHTVS